MPEHRIESLDDPRLAPYRGLKKSNLTRWSGRFIAEGVRVVERLLESGIQVESIFLSDDQRHRFPADLGDRHPLLTCPQSLAELVVGYRFHAGVLACGVRPTPKSLAEILPQHNRPALLFCCPNTTDPDNLGTIIRVAAGFGAYGLILGKGSCDPYSRRCLRVSMGNAFRMPLAESENVAQDLPRIASERNFGVVATVLSPDALPLDRWFPPERAILLLGNESEGLPEALRSLADHRVTIPMANEVDSLNVAIAAGIVAYAWSAVRKPSPALDC